MFANTMSVTGFDTVEEAMELARAISKDDEAVVETEVEVGGVIKAVFVGGK